jgi:uncharacterized membrane protein AbrB (regulator of aidB expression)
MNLNGNTLKMAFLMIVATLCVILVGLTIGASLGRLQLTEYEQLLGVLGITSIFSVIAQAFIHSNIGQSSGNDNSEVPKSNIGKISSIPESDGRS